LRKEQVISKYSKDNMYRMDGYLDGHVLERPYTSDKVYGKVGEQEARDIDDNHQRYRDIRFDLLRSLLANKKAVFGSVVILLFILVAILAPYIAPYSYDAVDLPNMLKAPSVSHPLGTDELGRDIFSRIIYGARVSLKVSLFSVGIALIIGVVLGALAGYFGGVVDYIISGLTDIVWSFPVTLLAIAFVAALGPSLTNLILALALTGWTGFTRLVRGEFLAIREKEFIAAAKALGIPNRKILFRHMIPNSLAPIIVLATMELPKAIIVESSLSFLGLGAQPPTPSWGSIMSAGRSYILEAPWIFLFPGLVIAILVLAVNLFGDALRDTLDPKLKN
jgi:peptide/nickel transport system permease protein